jgi:hypothetical protein
LDFVVPSVYVFNIKLDVLDVIYPRNMQESVVVTSRGGVGECMDFNELTKTRTDTYTHTHSRRNPKQRKDRKGRKNAQAWRIVPTPEASPSEATET